MTYIILFIAVLANALVTYRLVGIINRLRRRVADLQDWRALYTDHESPVINYCLGHILKDAILREDYQTAAKCRDLMEQYARLGKTY